MRKKIWVFEKKGLQMSFAWLFAIIAGAVILFLAIYFSIRFTETEQLTTTAKTGKEIGVLLNPLETGFETGKTTSLSIPIETRIYNKCRNEGVFGKQIIQISQKSFNKWTDTNLDVSFYNKYIFSEEYTEGKQFYIFSKPFNFPFKVADLICITSSLKEYCFISPPEIIEDEILDLNQKNLLAEKCAETADVKVCFNDNDCDVNVNYEGKYVEKKGEKMYFEGDALMYAAIFSNKEIYECQLKRLMQKTSNLALLYKDKAVFVARTGCNSNLNLLGLSNSANSLESSANLNSVNNIAIDIEEKNDDSSCRLW